ncbi:adenosylcobinamide kinase/adenosylcobinamide phosphate guanyltransferase [Oxalicibacterium flavum]|uniref:Bifunctional adenosylcobalamin biosynthesis protein n=1 Tax=Oxalicibacterium flavum TaxID=179467 RepID=A0A8J2XXG2_9BURK|nr:bifunctional adenosylcobinamide kinase/adenosylcobinamide-phosphate guanylyltransferase [Oxalicibacterium flavum]GGC10813.1 adenosylcobinamide kinase/adenosylcobinamide phosphate guanyltransferase [Oxalicibacterium flavum]
MTRMLVIGGARSGKSAHAEALALASGRRLVYVATAQSGDEEMAQRIAHHRARRDQAWTTVEAPIALAEAIARHSAPDTVVLVDCLTVWLSNLLFAERIEFPEVGPIEAPAVFHAQRVALLDALANVQGDVILVSNEVGQGIIPTGAVTRWYVDEAGRLNQAIAAVCDRAVLVVAGLPLQLKG